MKKNINRSVYNTETAVMLGRREGGAESQSDFGYWCEDLYRTKAGKYFIHGQGGAQSRYGKWVGNTGCWGEDIRTLTREEAQDWAEENLSVEKYEAAFGVLDEPVVLHINDIDGALHSKFMAEVETRQVTIKAMMEEILRERYGDILKGDGVMKKVEYREMKNLGISEKAAEVYSNSDWTVYHDGEFFEVRLGSEVVSENNTASDIDAFFEQFAE